MQRSGAGRIGSLPAYGAMEIALPVSLAENPSRQYLSMRSFYLVTKYAIATQLTSVNLHDPRHRFGFRMEKLVPLHRLAQLMGHDSLGDDQATVHRKICNTRLRRVRGCNTIPTRISRREKEDSIFEARCTADEHVEANVDPSASHCGHRGIRWWARSRHADAGASAR
jgi:hypothetical protein